MNGNAQAEVPEVLAVRLRDKTNGKHAMIDCPICLGPHLHTEDEVGTVVEAPCSRPFGGGRFYRIRPYSAIKRLFGPRAWKQRANDALQRDFACRRGYRKTP